jgi:hypothetical protein
MIEKLSTFKVAKTKIAITFSDQQPYEQNCNERRMEYLNTSQVDAFTLLRFYALGNKGK